MKVTNQVFIKVQSSENPRTVHIMSLSTLRRILEKELGLAKDTDMVLTAHPFKGAEDKEVKFY